jgi:hypothetical protein
VFYRITADFIVSLHFLWIVFLVIGAFIGRRHRWIKILHIAGIGFAITIQIFGWYCPLTHLEVWLRQRHDPSLGYSGSFIINYVQKLVYIELSERIIFSATLFLIAASVWIYLQKPKKP